jgi:hypothetical protein
MEVLQTSPLATWVRRPCGYDFSGAETLTHASPRSKFARTRISRRQSLSALPYLHQDSITKRCDRSE